MPPKLKKKKFSALQQKQPNFSLGIKGEQLACDFLSNSGYTVLTRNFCNSKAEEIDIVAFDYQNLELVFLEVKTRKNFYFGSPSTTITQRKLKKMTNLAQRYLDKYPLPHDFRFDLIAIATETDEIDHYQSISWLSGKQ